LVLVLTNINNIIDIFSSDGDHDLPQVAVIDNTEHDGLFSDMLSSHDDGRFQYIAYSGNDLDSAIDAARDDEYDFVLYLTGENENIHAEFYSNG
ncbi:hypothetical protein, partial [Pseudomonas sp. 2822-17]|uniref:hypothetical protein n=1 Tax=Pseudomonas sp. 2822-17 TaxID=1712678 RepID=UPI001C472AAA